MSEKLLSFTSLVDLPPDITFVVDQVGKTAKTIDAHKYFLAKSSPVFRALIYNKWNSEMNSNDQVIIKGTSYVAFKALIEYTYTGELDLGNLKPEDVDETKKLADWYHFPEISTQIKEQKVSSTYVNSDFQFSSDTMKLIPTDVKFVIEQDEDDANEENKVVEAHKYHLSLYSSVFKAMLFGPMKQDEIIIRGTTVTAFKTLIDYIYGNIGVLSVMSEFSLMQLYHVVNISEMYHVPGLRKSAEETILEKYGKENLSKNNVVDIIFEAKRWPQFMEVSEKLLNMCMTFLARDVLKTTNDIIDFSSLHSNGPKADVAFQILADLPVCHNCYFKPCRKGQLVEYDQILKGSRISSYNDTISGQILDVLNHRGTGAGQDKFTIKFDDGRRMTFSYKSPPKDADVVQNPSYYYSLYENGEFSGGIYWNCSKHTYKQ